MNLLRTFTLLLSLALGASITNLFADTNNPNANEPEFFSTISPNNNQTANSFIEDYKQSFEHLEFLTNMFSSIQAPDQLPFSKAIKTIEGLSARAKEIDANASVDQLYKGLLGVNKSMIYFSQSFENGFENAQEFNPTFELPEAITSQDVSALIEENKTIFKGITTKLEEAASSINESMQDAMSTLLMEVRNQLIKLDAVLQNFNTNIESSSIVNKVEVQKDIKNLRNILNQIRKEVATSEARPEVIKGIYQINKNLIDYLKDSQKHKFRKWATVDLINSISRGGQAKMENLEELFAHVMKNNEELEQLEKDAEKIDLTVINKMARFVGDYIVDPVQKYDLILYSLAAGATVGAGLYSAYFFDQTFFSHPQSWFRKLFGYRNYQAGKMINIPEPKVIAVIAQALRNFGAGGEEALANHLMQAIINLPANRESQLDALKNVQLFELLLNTAKRSAVQPIIPISKIDEFILEHKNGAAAIGIGLLGLASYCYYKIWHSKNEYWSHKLNFWFNKLKGGALAKKADKFDFVFPTTNFDDIIGFEYEKSQLYPQLKYIKNPERWDTNGFTPVTGIILTGPTRSGKTFFAKAICGEIHKQNPDKAIRFISIDAHDIKAQGIARWMEIAKMLAPCVLFIDEIDLLGLQRSQDRTLLADFLQQLSGIGEKDQNKQVFVVATTNKPENIDHAMLQSGRLALQIRFKYPNMQDRKTYIQNRLDKFAIDASVFDIDVDKLARETHEKSFEDLKLMLDTAFIHLSLKGQVISQEILEWALDSQLRRIIDIDQKQIADSEKRMIAAHYAGETLMHLLLDMNEKVAKVTTREIVVKVKEESVVDQYYTNNKQTGLEQGGLFTYQENDTNDIISQKEMLNKCKTLLAARIAERILTGSSSIYFGWKKNSAFNRLRTIVADGIDFKSLSKSGQNALSDQTQIKLNALELEVEKLLLAHKPALIALADALQEKQTLTIREIMNIFNTAEGIIPEATKEISDDLMADVEAAIAA